MRSTEDGVEIFVKLEARQSTQSKYGMGKVMYARPAAHVGRQMTSWVARGAPEPDTESAGPREALRSAESAEPRHRERQAPTQRAPGLDTESAGPQQRVLSCYHFIFEFLDSKPWHEYGMNLDAGDSRCHGRSFSPFFDAEKELVTQIASVNGSYNHGLAFASHSALSLKARMHH